MIYSYSPLQVLRRMVFRETIKICVEEQKRPYAFICENERIALGTVRSLQRKRFIDSSPSSPNEYKVTKSGRQYVKKNKGRHG